MRSKKGVYEDISKRVQALITDLNHLYEFHQLDYPLQFCYDTLMKIVTPIEILAINEQPSSKKDPIPQAPPAPLISSEQDAIIISLSEQSESEHKFPMKNKKRRIRRLFNPNLPNPDRIPARKTPISRARRIAEDPDLFDESSQASLRSWIDDMVKGGLKFTKKGLITQMRCILGNRNANIDDRWYRAFMKRNPDCQKYMRPAFWKNLKETLQPPAKSPPINEPISLNDSEQFEQAQESQKQAPLQLYEEHEDYPEDSNHDDDAENEEEEHSASNESSPSEKSKKVYNKDDEIELCDAVQRFEHRVKGHQTKVMSNRAPLENRNRNQKPQ